MRACVSCVSIGCRFARHAARSLLGAQDIHNVCRRRFAGVVAKAAVDDLARCLLLAEPFETSYEVAERLSREGQGGGAGGAKGEAEGRADVANVEREKHTFRMRRLASKLVLQAKAKMQQ